ncbi:MAG: DegV family protein [Candidatus Heimdallarchaeota archaeon]|nr:DegV family protein [Candidatus Heimdallarchaeota archaeon]
MSKQKVAIVTDASGDIPPELVDKLKISIIPVILNFEDKSFKSYGIEKGLTWDEFYKLTEKEVPSTAIAGPGHFKLAFEQALEVGESAIGIFISDKMSGVYNSAKMVSEQHMQDKDITVYHGGVNSVGIAVLVIEAARLAAQGMAKEEICKKLEQWIPTVQYAGIINTLDNLVRTGRLSKVKKFMADMLHFKPILGFIDGAIHTYGNIRADDALIIEQMKKFGMKVLENMIPENKILLIGHTRWPEAAEEIAEYLRKNSTNNKEIMVQEEGVINSFYVGKKLLAIGYIGKFNPDWLLKTK